MKTKATLGNQSTWFAPLCLGFAGLSCVGNSTDADTAGQDPTGQVDGLFRTTVVQMDTDGSHVVSTYFLTAAEMEHELQVRTAALAARANGSSDTSENVLELAKDTSCSDPAGTWAYDNVNLTGNRCCISGYGSLNFNSYSQFVGSLSCGFTGSNAKSVWSGDASANLQQSGPPSLGPNVPPWTINNNVGLSYWISMTRHTSINPGGPGEGSGDEWSTNWTNLLQGVAHDSTNWYFINKTRVFLIPLAEGNIPGRFGDWFNDDFASLKASWVDIGFLFDFHFGDGDFYPSGPNGHLFIPVETLGGRFLTVWSGAPDYRSHLIQQRPAQLMTMHSNFAWLAINPSDGKLWAATRFDTVSSLEKYTINPDLSVTWFSTVSLKNRNGTTLTLNNQVQGGAFGNGRLYIAVGQPDPGIYVFTPDGVISEKIPFPVYGDTGYEEMEGMDVVNMAGYPSSGISGQLHQIKMRNKAGNDALKFYHRLIW